MQVVIFVQWNKENSTENRTKQLKRDKKKFEKKREFFYCMHSTDCCSYNRYHLGIMWYYVHDVINT